MRITADDAYRIRKVYRLTLEDMAALCGCSTSLINKIEKKQRSFSEKIMRRLIEELQLTPEKLARILEVYNEFE